MTKFLLVVFQFIALELANPEFTDVQVLRFDLLLYIDWLLEPSSQLTCGGGAAWRSGPRADWTKDADGLRASTRQGGGHDRLVGCLQRGGLAIWRLVSGGLGRLKALCK